MEVEPSQIALFAKGAKRVNCRGLGPHEEVGDLRSRFLLLPRRQAQGFAKLLVLKSLFH
jgi:hypothetical protein